jgi:hypothetical protein
MIAEVLEGFGNCTVNVLLEVLSAPKSNTQTAPPAPALYINAPRAVNAEVQIALLKEIYAVVPEFPIVGTCAIVRVRPPAVYPEATTSPVDV